MYYVHYQFFYFPPHTQHATPEIGLHIARLKKLKEHGVCVIYTDAVFAHYIHDMNDMMNE